jgi:hypothetical protein
MRLRIGMRVAFALQTSRWLACESLSALARSKSASTSERRKRNWRPTRIAGSVPESIQLRIVCEVT